VRGALAEIRAGHGEFAKFCSEVFEQFDAMTAELAVASTQATQTAAEPDDQPTADVTAYRQQVQRILEEAQQERAQWRSTQEAIQHQLDQLAAIAGQQNQSVQAQLENRAADEDLQQRLQQMAQQQALLERERAELEAELEAVRGRAAEMAESLAEQKRLLAQQQVEWAREFNRMRCLLEGMSGRLAEGLAGAVAGNVEPAPGAAPAAAPPAGDPVLDSVLAQFAMLQKDVARRRASD